MKTETELRQAITDAMAIFEDGVSQEYKGEKIGNLVAALEVFTDHNFTQEEQNRLFNIAAQRLHELEQKVTTE